MNDNDNNGGVVLLNWHNFYFVQLEYGDGDGGDGIPVIVAKDK